jgi:hypothetical protein
MRRQARTHARTHARKRRKGQPGTAHVSSYIVPMRAHRPTMSAAHDDTAGGRHAATARRRRTRQHVALRTYETNVWIHDMQSARTLRGGSVCWCCRHASCSMCAETSPATIQKPETAKTVGNDADAGYRTRPCRRAARTVVLASSKSRASKPQGVECDDR